MPTYEYECGEQFERFQSMRDDPVKGCPICGSPVRRLIGTGAVVIVKGSGFHTGDYPRATTRCGRGTPCCGRGTPCDRPPCEE